MSLANPEQLKAIEHKGGVLLSAGAGSGKTFVLTQHMIYLAKGWIQEFNGDEDAFSIKVKKELKKIVLMTFTNKAAGEIELRVVREFKTQKDNTKGQDQRLWEIILSHIRSLTITTIHGFCFKLIRQGFFPNINPNIQMSGESMYIQGIEELFLEWLESKDENSRDLFLKSKSDIIESLITIFGDPSLREAWLKKDFDGENLYNDLLKSNDKFKRLLFKKDIKLDHGEYAGKKWFDELVGFLSKYKKDFYSESDFISLFNNFHEMQYKIATTPRVGSVDDVIRGLYTEYKSLKDYLKSHQEDFLAYFDEKETLKTYINNFHELISFVDNGYREKNLFAFSDLEYETLRGLQNSESQKAVSLEYQYLIIDEFQDTSFTQYEIIKKVISNDFSRLFCVGDPKQAIYGFRGGELGVFHDVEKNIVQNLSLLNNYRSDKNIIAFNNILFDHIFSLGTGYEGEDEYSVHVDYQKFPDTKTDLGEVEKICVELTPGEEKLYVSDVEDIEAFGILENIKKTLKETDKSICVLYRKLKPSKLMAKILIKENIPFISQVKVPIFEDTILSLFYSLVRYTFNKEEESLRFLSFEINTILSLSLGREFSNIDNEIENFFQNKKTIGLYLAFLKLLNDLSFVTSNIKESLGRLKDIIKISAGNFSQIESLLSSIDSKKYNLDFHYGEGVKRVHLMTAHASKGLEFNHVIVGGIYTNESSKSFYNMLGSFPGSFQWYKDLHSKQKLKTPTFLLEDNVKKLKEFSETKRLFYVANTRAEHSLAWVDIEFNGHKFNPYKNCWINGIKHFFEESDFNVNKEQMLTYNIEEADSQSTKEYPLFHIDSMGSVLARAKSKYFLMPELSVTRYSVLASCPRKFYLKNILKLEAQSEFKETFKDNVEIEELTSEVVQNSSMQRGSEIHELISQVIKKEIELNNVENKYLSQVQFAVDNFDLNCLKTNFISEEEIKFSVFGQMISGIPDLIVHDSERGEYSVWDFKTGRVDEVNHENYWAQLYLYAFYIFHLPENKDKLKHMKLVLCYVDPKQNLERNVSFSDVENYVYQLREKSNQHLLKNESHCSKCEFNNLCR
jgi:ATP-dependent helicase/nuclease subunit A